MVSLLEGYPLSELAMKLLALTWVNVECEVLEEDVSVYHAVIDDVPVKMVTQSNEFRYFGYVGKEILPDDSYDLDEVSYMLTGDWPVPLTAECRVYELDIQSDDVLADIQRRRDEYYQEYLDHERRIEAGDSSREAKDASLSCYLCSGKVDKSWLFEVATMI